MAINFTLLSTAQLENVIRTARDQRTRAAAQEELGTRENRISSRGTLPLFGKRSEVGGQRSEGAKR